MILLGIDGYVPNIGIEALREVLNTTSNKNNHINTLLEPTLAILDPLFNKESSPAEKCPNSRSGNYELSTTGTDA